jgi:hypothetical protein
LKTLKVKDVESLFDQLADVEIHAAVETAAQGSEKDKLMAQAYIMAINRCKKLLQGIMKDVEV